MTVVEAAIRDLNRPNVLRRQLAMDRAGWRQRYESDRFQRERAEAWKPLVRAMRARFRRELLRAANLEWHGNGAVVDHSTGVCRLNLWCRVYWRGLIVEVQRTVGSLEEVAAVAWQLSGALLAWEGGKNEAHG